MKTNLLYLLLFLISCTTIKENSYTKEEITGEYKTHDTLTFFDIINVRGKQVSTFIAISG